MVTPLKQHYSTIEIVNDLSTGVDDWIIEQVHVGDNNEDCYDHVLAIGFKRGNEKKVVFNNLSFGFKLYDSDGELLLNMNYPRSHVKYFAVNTNGDDKLDESEILEICYLPIVPLKNYKLELWTEESGIFSECSHEFMFEPWDKPKGDDGNTWESWVWNADRNDWMSPIGDPPDTAEFRTYKNVWNEDKKEWSVDKSKPIQQINVVGNIAESEGVEPPDYELDL